MRLLGIDLGTGSVKLVTLDPDGVERAVASEPYALSSPQPGWAEIAPQAWWDALVRAAARPRGCPPTSGRRSPRSVFRGRCTASC